MFSQFNYELCVGGKEVRTYGIDPHTGHLQYACSTDGCKVKATEAGSSGEFLILSRHNQIVRAIEPRTGTERWNFSVGRHEASLLHTELDSRLQLLRVISDSFFFIKLEFILFEAIEKCSNGNFDSHEEQMECFVNSPSDKDALDEESHIKSLEPSFKFKVHF